MKTLRLPKTPKARDMLRQHIRLAGGWDFPDGTNAADIDWDIAMLEAEEFCREMEKDEAERLAREATHV